RVAGGVCPWETLKDAKSFYAGPVEDGRVEHYTSEPQTEYVTAFCTAAAGGFTLSSLGTPHPARGVSSLDDPQEACGPASANGTVDGRVNWQAHAAHAMGTTMPFEYVSVDEAMKRRGLRMVVVGDVPSPWSEAAKGILHIKGIEWV